MQKKSNDDNSETRECPWGDLYLYCRPLGARHFASDLQCNPTLSNLSFLVVLNASAVVNYMLAFVE